MNALEQKLIEWFESEAVQARGWSARLFWRPDSDGSPYGELRVDARELEVLFAALLDLPSEHKADLDAERDGRGTFLTANAHRHELPLLTPRSR
jgi:hypothetical protein